MILCDVNVLVYALRRDADRHDEYRSWLEQSLAEESAFGVSEIILSSVVRIVTHPRIFAKPSSLNEAFGFTQFLLDRPNAVRISPGTRHWPLFVNLCQSADAKGNLITDAYLAALAIESGAEWLTTDRDFARFANLRWRHPLATK